MSTHRDNPIIARKSDHEDVASARVAHELANLLDGSLRNIGLAIRGLRAGADGAATDERVLHRLDTASVGMRQMASLLRAWLGAGDGVADDADKIVTFGDIMRRCAAMLAPAAVAANVRLDMTCEPAVAELAIDNDAHGSPAMAWPHLIDNLVRNSIQALTRKHASKRESPATVEARIDITANHITLTVTDNGPGFAPDFFDTAGRFRFGLSTRAGGHGVGLALCRDLVSEMRGTIQLANRPQGGAQVTVIVPFHAGGNV